MKLKMFTVSYETSDGCIEHVGIIASDYQSALNSFLKLKIECDKRCIFIKESKDKVRFIR